jgi:hypothetical protein
MESIITLHENTMGRKLSQEEKLQCISQWFNKSRDKALDFLKMINTKNTVNFTVFHNGEEKNILDIINIKPPYLSGSYDQPETAYLSKHNKEIFLETVEFVLLKKQERTRECYRSLFTAYCIENSIDFEDLSSVLDKNILDEYRETGKKPEQYEIYLKYHPSVKKDSAGVRSSEMLKKFRCDLRSFLKQKSPEIFS